MVPFHSYRQNLGFLPLFGILGLPRWPWMPWGAQTGLNGPWLHSLAYVSNTWLDSLNVKNYYYFARAIVAI